MTLLLTRAPPLLLGLLLLSVPASAQSPRLVPEAPSHRLLLHNSIGSRFNSIGLDDQTRLGYQKVLYRDDSALLRDNYFYVGASSRLNPASIKVGPMVELQPLSIFSVRLLADYVRFFSSFNALQSFSSPNEDYSNATLEARGAAKENYATSGLHFLIEPLLSLKVGPVLLRNRFSLDYWSMNLREGDRVWYDATPDILLPGKGFTLANELDVLYVGRASLLVGARYSLLKPLYGARDYAPGEAAVQDNSQQRLGVLAAYIFFEEPYTAFNRPTLLLHVAWYLQHRYRAGTEVSQAVPLVALAFAFQSDLLGSAAKH